MPKFTRLPKPVVSIIEETRPRLEGSTLWSERALDQEELRMIIWPSTLVANRLPTRWGRKRHGEL